MKSANEYLKESIGECHCDTFYTYRKKIDPECTWCNWSDRLTGVMETYAKDYHEAHTNPDNLL